MWWIAFTAIDLYVGLIVLEAMMPSLSAEKVSRAKAARNLIVALLVVTVLAFTVMLVKRWLR
jgi:hypothetical protein